MWGSIAINLEMTQPVLMTDGIYLPQPPLIQIDWKVFLIRPILRTRRWRHQTLSLYSWQNNPNSTRNVDNCPGLVINWINLGGGNRQNHQTERGDETGLARQRDRLRLFATITLTPEVTACFAFCLLTLNTNWIWKQQTRQLSGFVTNYGNKNTQPTQQQRTVEYWWTHQDISSLETTLAHL